MDAQDSDITAPAIAHCITAVTSAEPENEMLTKLFELEGLGIAPENDEENKDLLPYFNKYSKQMSFDGGFVTAPFPLKDNVIDLADNYSSAIKRLASLHRQLENNLEQKKWYVKILTQYEAEDIIEKAHESIPNSVGLYYMPHSGVWRPQKPKPLRIVFDASSKRKGQLSLNDVTHKGESLIKKIHDILVASRINEIILTCDIEAAFTQIRLQNTHKDLCRFLWLKDPNKPPYRENIVEYRFKRVPFGAKPSPSILNMALLTFLQSRNTPLSKEILDNLYVDNVLLGASTPSEAISKYKESKALLSEIGMNLREYSSNRTEVNDAIPLLTLYKNT
nr:reverse transcriptase [Haemonchus contortus]